MCIRDRPSGISEIIVSPAIAGDELRAVLDDADQRVGTLRELDSTPPREIAKRHAVAWLDWAQIRPR